MEELSAEKHLDLYPYSTMRLALSKPKRWGRLQGKTA
jgi:hypothetical protein